MNRVNTNGRLRDSQRGKVYAAERGLRSGRRFETLAACQRYVDIIISGATYRQIVQEYKGWSADSGVEVRPGRGARRAFQRRNTITLPRWARSELVILHELTHVATRDGPAHGWQFCDAFLRLVSAYMFPSDWRAMKASFKEHRVRFRKPRKARRRPTAAQRAVLIERLRAARAAKAEKAAKAARDSAALGR